MKLDRFLKLILDDGQIKALSSAGFKVYITLLARALKDGGTLLPEWYGEKEFLATTGVSLQTLNVWLKKLFAAGLLKKRNGCVAVSLPKDKSK